MKKEISKKTYEALGFLEAMIAIMVVGLTSVVLMRIAVDTMQNILQNEAIDNVTQYAVEGAEIAQDIALKDRLEEEEVLFPTSEDYEVFANCFILTEEEGEIQFKKEEGNFVKYEIDKRVEYKDKAILDEEDELFRIVCLEDPPIPPEGGQTFVMARIIVGQRHSGGKVTKGNLVKDYTYVTVVRL
jgi:hypothetical protein